MNEPWEERSNTKQDKFKLQTIERTDAYLTGTFAPSLKTGISEELGIDADVRMGDAEETVLFGEAPAFEDIVESMQDLEGLINGETAN